MKETAPTRSLLPAWLAASVAERRLRGPIPGEALTWREARQPAGLGERRGATGLLARGAAACGRAARW